MKKWISATLFTAIAATPALAAAPTYYVVKDVVGNCSVVLSSGRDFPGMKIISKAYSSEASARGAVGDIKVCSASAKPY
jgi:hypothetical protein